MAAQNDADTQDSSLSAPSVWVGAGPDQTTLTTSLLAAVVDVHAAVREATSTMAETTVPRAETDRRGKLPG